MRFEKLTAEARVAAAKYSKMAITLVALSVAVLIGLYFVVPTYKTLDDAKKQIPVVEASVKSMQSRNDEIALILQDNDGQLEKTFMTKDEFVKFMGKICDVHNVELVQLAGGYESITNNIHTMDFRFEVKGELSELSKVVTALQEQNTRYLLKAMSMRKTEDFLWFDRDSLTNEGMTWFDISNLPANVKDTPALTTIDEEGKEIPVPELPLSIADIYGSESMTLYMNVSFISGEV